MEENRVFLICFVTYFLCMAVGLGLNEYFESKCVENYKNSTKTTEEITKLCK